MKNNLNTKERILSLAISLFAQKDYNGVSIAASHGERTRGLVVPKRHSETPSSHLRECYEASAEFTMVVAEGISGRVKFLPLAWAGMPKTSFRKNSDSPLNDVLLQKRLLSIAYKATW
ncbi:MAG TPA: hypothetical protein EYQ43_07880 [Methyloprofundus sp.]|nr:hypothetical protein [Methyloprofundus sp.]